MERWKNGVAGLILLCVFLCGCNVRQSDSVEKENEKITVTIRETGSEPGADESLPEVGTIELFALYEESGGEWWNEEENITQFAWGQALNVWESYITIYEATKDKTWLDKLTLQIDTFLGKRDMVTGKKDFNGFSLPAWSNTSNPAVYEGYCFSGETGLVLHPVLRFVELVRENSVQDYYEKADEYLQACIEALSIFDREVREKAAPDTVPQEACYDLWREEEGTGGVHGYYIGHLYYSCPEFASQGYVPDNMLPYNQSLSLVQCYPVLYRLTGEEFWKEKTEKSWNWLRDGIRKDGDIWWWYYSQYYNWNRARRILIWEMEAPENKMDFYEDYDGHYSVDLMFLIEAHKIGVVSDEELLEISKNKKQMGLSESGWAYVMNDDAVYETNNLKAAVYFDYFVRTLEDKEYIGIIFPELEKELAGQYAGAGLADMSTKVNGTCLRLLAAAVSALDGNK